MDNLVFINESNDVLTDSLRVAVKFEKDHSKVIRSIDDLLEKSYVIDTECNPKMDLHKMFCLCYDDIPQPNGGFRKSKRYVMNRDGFTILVMGFTGSKAIKFKLEYMNAFNEMEASIKKNLPHNYIEALEALLVSEKEKQALAEAKKVIEEEKKVVQAELNTAIDTIKENEPVIDMFKRSIPREGVLIRESSKYFEQFGYYIGIKNMYPLLQELKYVFRNERGRIEAYQSARNSGLVTYGSDPGDEYWEAKAVTVMITLKGFVKLEELSRKKRSVFEKYGRFTI